MTTSRTYPRRGLHGAVVHAIGVRILRGELQPGDTVPAEDELSGELGVSRTVMREALKVLAAKRLVESRPKTGTRVRPRRDWNLLDPDVLAWQVEAGVDPRFLRDALELRRLIEPGAARLAAERATDEHVEAIAAAQEGMEAAGESSELFLEPDIRFHTALLEATQNELLEHMAAILTSMFRTLFAFSARPPGWFARSAPRHREVLEAIRDHDPDRAEAALLRLIEDARRNVEWTIEHHLAPDAATPPR